VRPCTQYRQCGARFAPQFWAALHALPAMVAQPAGAGAR